MAEIVNLRRARKARQRRSAEADAAENRARHGAPKMARGEAADEARRRERLLDGAKREPD